MRPTARLADPVSCDSRGPRRRLGCAGQASVELVALLPAIGAIALLCWQAVVFGQAVWLSGAAARSAARAQALADDPLAAARRVLPGALRGGLRVSADDRSGVVIVHIAVPTVVGGARIATTSAEAQFVGQTG